MRSQRLLAAWQTWHGFWTQGNTRICLIWRMAEAASIFSTSRRWWGRGICVTIWSQQNHRVWWWRGMGSRSWTFPLPSKWLSTIPISLHFTCSRDLEDGWGNRGWIHAGERTHRTMLNSTRITSTIIIWGVSLDFWFSTSPIQQTVAMICDSLTGWQWFCLEAWTRTVTANQRLPIAEKAHQV